MFSRPSFRNVLGSTKSAVPAQLLETTRTGRVLGFPLVVLLERALTDARIAEDVDPLARAVHAGLPRALPAGHLALRGQLGRGLAEVPHVPLGVLRVPVGGALAEVAIQIQAVAHGGGADAVDRPGLVGDREDVTGCLAVLLAAVDVGRPRLQREPRVVDLPDELPRRHLRGRLRGARLRGGGVARRLAAAA